MTRSPYAFALAALLAVAPLAAHAAEPEKVTPGSPAAGGPHDDDQAREERRANHIEGHIAFLKAELAITPAQSDAWDKVAAAMRDDVKDFQDTSDKNPASDTEPTAVVSLSQRATYADIRAKGEKRFLEAFKPLYDSFSADQKQAADDLFASRGGY